MDAEGSTRPKSRAGARRDRAPAVPIFYHPISVLRGTRAQRSILYCSIEADSGGGPMSLVLPEQLNLKRSKLSALRNFPD